MNIFGPLSSAAVPLTIAAVIGTISFGPAAALASATVEPNDGDTFTAHVLIAHEESALNESIARENARFVEFAAAHGSTFVISPDGMSLSAADGIDDDTVLELLNLAEAQGIRNVRIDGSFGEGNVDMSVSPSS